MSILETLKFKNIDAAPAQVVDEMTVVPLVGENRGDIAEPEALVFQRTNNYGSMVYKNEDEEKSTIVPSNMMVRGPSAQDHAMSGSGIIQAKGRVTFNNACCIEETQGGFLTDSNNEYDILPVGLRKKLLSLEKRKMKKYNKLWPEIAGWLQHSGASSSRAHLRYFYDNPVIKESLETFSAEFEPVSYQIGAIILFQEKIVGIEIMPSVAHWEIYWKLLIRGCYGAELIKQKNEGTIKPSALQMPDFPNVVASPNALISIVDDFEKNIRHSAIQQLSSIQVKGVIDLGKKSDLHTGLVQTTAGGGGDIILQKDEPIYLSLVV